ncbi:LPXTG cell wall anchor domain-containing protein, partial [Lactococcus sp. S64]
SDSDSTSDSISDSVSDSDSTSDSISDSVSDSDSNSGYLPKTGEESGDSLTEIGTLLTTLTMLLVAIGVKRKRKEN